MVLTTIKETVFENLRRIADVLVKMIGRNCEVAIHDFSELPNSLVYLTGTLTKRKPGAPITDLVVKGLRQQGNAVEDVYAYTTKTKDGKNLKSSTTYIRNNKGKVIGAFCVNFDTTEFLNSISVLEELIQVSNLHEEGLETFASSPNETIEALTKKSVSTIGKQPKSMSRDEKIDLIKMLEYNGVFMVKGAVDYLAKTMGVSKYTIYTYLREVRSTSTENFI